MACSSSVIVKEAPHKDKLKEVPPNMQKICLVCGDKALGYNFNAISCESCKAFFRRNALVRKEFKCPFTNSCDITVVTRRFCQKCRLEKCLSIGMVKEFIMSEEDKAEKRKKIEENRAKKRNHCESSDETVSSSKNMKKEDECIPTSNYNIPESSVLQYDVLNSTTCSPHSVHSTMNNDLDIPISSPAYGSPNVTSMMGTQYISDTSDYINLYSQRERYDIEEKSVHFTLTLPDSYQPADSIDSNTYEPDYKKPNTIRSILTNDSDGGSRTHVCSEIPAAGSDPNINKARDILQDVERIEPNSIESILCEAIKLEFEAFTSLSQCSGSSRELNEVERAKLNELIVAHKALHDPIDDDLSMLIGNNAAFKPGDGKQDVELITIVNITAIAIRRLIKMAKKINAFKNMCEEDQIALLKGGCTEMMLLRSTMTYDEKRNHWKIPHQESLSIGTEVLKLAKGNIYQAHESFQRSFLKRWREDENVILILSAILLFTPNRPRVVHADVIKLEQNSYYYLLRRYLESVYPGCEAKSTFLKLIQKILELRKLAEEITGVYLDVNPIEPLLMEIFDLKQRAT